MLGARRYEKMMTIPPLPTAGSINDWLTCLGEQLVLAGGFTDQLDLQWLSEVFTKSYAELRIEQGDRWIKASLLLYSVLVKCSDNGPDKALKRLLDNERRMSMAPSVSG